MSADDGSGTRPVFSVTRQDTRVHCDRQTCNRDFASRVLQRYLLAMAHLAESRLTFGAGSPDPGELMLAVLVLYQQSLEQSVTFQSLSAGLREESAPLQLLVYDNSPTPVGKPGSVAHRGWDVCYVHDPSNPGVSRAYVEGARIAANHSKQWLLLLDQDTWFPPDVLSRYVASIQQHPEVRLFAPILRGGSHILSPCRYRFRLGSPLSLVSPGLHSLAGLSVLNSGTCVAVKDYLELGGHDVRIALDFADHEFIDRFKRKHDRFVVIDAECAHDFFGVTTQSTAGRLTRFGHYCRGAKFSGKGLSGALLTAAVVGARACRLSIRYRSLGFLRVAVDTLLGGEPS
jgi:rhamnosyltransferase